MYPVEFSNKDIDVLTSVSYSVERNQSMDFTQSYWSMPWAALTMDSTMRAGSSLRTSELHGQRVARAGEVPAVDVAHAAANPWRQRHPEHGGMPTFRAE